MLHVLAVAVLELLSASTGTRVVAPYGVLGAYRLAALGAGVALCCCLLVTVAQFGTVLLVLLLAALGTGFNGGFAHLLWLTHRNLAAHKDGKCLVVDLVDHGVE